LEGEVVHAFAIFDNNLIAGTVNNGVFRRPLSEVTVVQWDDIEIPVKFSLSQNYPNPFNPSTIINYEIGSPTLVCLKIYDLLGREIAVLVNDWQKKGNYSVIFNGKQCSSGIYFYKLSAGHHYAVKKMLVVK